MEIIGVESNREQVIKRTNNVGIKTHFFEMNIEIDSNKDR